MNDEPHKSFEGPEFAEEFGALVFLAETAIEADQSHESRDSKCEGEYRDDDGEMLRSLASVA